MPQALEIRKTEGNWRLKAPASALPPARITCTVLRCLMPAAESTPKSCCPTTLLSLLIGFSRETAGGIFWQTSSDLFYYYFFLSGKHSGVHQGQTANLRTGSSDRGCEGGNSIRRETDAEPAAPELLKSRLDNKKQAGQVLVWDGPP